MAVTGEEASCVIANNENDQPNRKLPLFRSCLNECATPVETKIIGMLTEYVQ